MNTALKNWSFFLFGFALAFDSSGVFGNAVLNRELEESAAHVDALLNSLKREDSRSDEENLADDWRNIGNDFRAALRQE